ncbi:hypothetical protein K435DRAFT_805356 [Dendrothele bispora CBS 962.96]|uniref:Uncharacterized protein n=1 Tax=Dendrothele bispora (strain CBS 962.96) TaxID=1314807 RepID=A0A4S8LB95_DENBC|nr:hypothetical protein K435DRAFT_805356 [Dendrothele bispora CBS 962.96]
MPLPITAKKPLPVAKPSTKHSRDAKALKCEAQESAMSEHLEDSPDETPVAKKPKQHALKPTNTRQLCLKNRPVLPLKPASTSRTCQKQKARSLSSFIDDGTQEESEEEEEEEGVKTEEQEVEEGEVSGEEASDAERPLSPVKQKGKTAKHIRNRPRTSKTCQPPVLEHPDTNEEDPDIKDGTNKEALTAPVGVPTCILRSKLPHHAMLRDPDFGAHAGCKTGSMLNVEDLLERIIRSRIPLIVPYALLVLPIPIIVAACIKVPANSAIAATPLVVIALSRCLWTVSKSSPKVSTILCNSPAPPLTSSRQLLRTTIFVSTVTELDDDNCSSFNQSFFAAGLWLERLTAARSHCVPSPEYTFTVTTDLDLDAQQPEASSSQPIYKSYRVSLRSNYKPNWATYQGPPNKVGGSCLDSASPTLVMASSEKSDFMLTEAPA